MKLLFCVMVICPQAVPEPTHSCAPGEQIVVPYTLQEKEPGHFVALNESSITLKPSATISIQCHA
jgi:hypothetical protein